jgi:hypothetical protein
MTVVEKPEGLAHTVPGELSLEGARFYSTSQVISSEVDVLLQLPDVLQETRLPARVTRIEPAGATSCVFVRFEELDVATALSLARLMELEQPLLSVDAQPHDDQNCPEDCE